MARRTKAEAEQTRLQIIEAARAVFHERGVSRTSLEQVAAKAGVTRGAVYWHFKNKADLFLAMRNQVFLPVVDGFNHELLATHADDPLRGIELSLLEILEVLANQPATRQTHQILTFRCEYVDEFAPVLERLHRQGGGDVAEVLLSAYSKARSLGQLRTGLNPTALAQDTQSFLTGLIYFFLASDGDSDHYSKARKMIMDHIALRRADSA